jgi:hypothetical protein
MALAELSLDLTRRLGEQVVALARVDDVEVGHLTDRGLIASPHITCGLVDGRGGHVARADAVAPAHRIDQRWGHQQLSGEQLCQAFAVHRGPENVVLGIEGELVGVKYPVTDLVRGGVALHRGASLGGQHDAARSARDHRAQ